MATRVVKKTISLPRELARESPATGSGRTENSQRRDSGSGRTARQARLKDQFLELQNYWSEKAKQKGILSERDLDRYWGQ